MHKRLKILLVEPFAAGSHKQWAQGFQKFSSHEVVILSLPGRHWKWRMHGAAVTLAEEFRNLDFCPDLIIASDMLDLATFKGLIASKMRNIPCVLYFHENQLTYPWSTADSDTELGRDNHYAFINYTSALVADRVFFNSDYHRKSFMLALPAFLSKFPDHQNLSTMAEIKNKSLVAYLGMDLRSLDDECLKHSERRKRATVLWNHRWEYDKNPREFFEALYAIQRRGLEFNLIVLGEQFKNSPKVFKEAKEILADRILHWGFVNDRREYAKWLWESDILPVTSYQDFFGGSIVEAMYCNVNPLLPNRLAYPEHIPSYLHHAFFYEDGELVNKLQCWIKDVSVLRKQQTQSFVERYDWRSIACYYDAVLNDMV